MPGISEEACLDLPGLPVYLFGRRDPEPASCEEWDRNAVSGTAATLQVWAQNMTVYLHCFGGHLDILLRFLCLRGLVGCFEK
ncbi:hypothetical protein MHYP_G00346180 [Metynnis hypsauchen]